MMFNGLEQGASLTAPFPQGYVTFQINYTGGYR